MTDAFLDWATDALGAAADVQLHRLPVEASFRSFYRLTSAAGTWVLMVSPPEKEQNRQFEVLAEIFEAAGVPVPHILARRPEQGWYLLTDLGSTDLEHAYAGSERDDAVRAAIDCLVRLQMVDDRAIPPYTAERFADELNIFRDWFVGRVLSTVLPRALEPVFKRLVTRAVAQPHCCVHRDYHCRNLLYEQGRLGVVDFQDALIGPVSYDLASLLHDCYHEFSDAEVARWTDHYLSRTPLMLEPDRFRKDLEYCAVQRQLKAIGIFARLKLRDGKSSHLPHIAPVLDRIHRLARRHGPLTPLADWLGEIDVTQALAVLAEAAVE